VGAFYGSVQVRSGNRNTVMAAAESAARAMRIRILVGPEIGGWVGIYPEGKGQDERVGREIAARIGYDVLHTLVHDDDVFAYWLFRHGNLVDSYWSVPGYFGEKNRAKEEAMVGNPEAFRFIQERVELLPKILARGNTLLAEQQLAEFADAMGIVNACTSYEYLKDGETEGIHGWSEFKEILGDELKQRGKQPPGQSLTQEQQRLKSDGLLLFVDERSLAIPRACVISDGFVVAWDHIRGTVEFAHYRRPWQEPESVELSTPAHISELTSDASGQHVAIKAINCAQVWEFEAGQWTKRIEVADPRLVFAVSITPDARLLAHSSINGIVITDLRAKQQTMAFPAREIHQMAFHPSGEWLVVTGPQLGLISLLEEPRYRLLALRAKSPNPGPDNLPNDYESVSKSVQATLEKTAAAMQASLADIEAKVQAGSLAMPPEQLAQLRKLVEDTIAKGKRGVNPLLLHNERIHRVGFSRDGRRLWCATERGLRVYEWSEVPRAGGALGKPILAFDPPVSDAGTGTADIYAVAEENVTNALVFGGGNGTVYRLDLAGQTRQLFQLPGNRSVLSLVVSTDGKTLGIATRANPMDRDAWEIWSYPALRDGAVAI
jgi:hypothetical protein